jgi:hypothetical protein
MKKISAAVGLPMSLALDPFVMYEALADREEDRHNIANATACYLDGLATNLAKATKDAMVKESVQQACSTKQVKLQIVPGELPKELCAKCGGDYYVGLTFENGDVTILVPSKRYWQNIDNISQLKTIDILAATASAPSGGSGGVASLPLPVRKYIRDSEAKVAAAMKKISTALGVAVTLDMDYAAWHAMLAEANSSVKEQFPGMTRRL